MKPAIWVNTARSDNQPKTEAIKETIEPTTPVHGCSGSTIARVGGDGIQPSGEVSVDNTQGDAGLTGRESSSLIRTTVGVLICRGERSSGDPTASCQEGGGSLGSGREEEEKRRAPKAVRSVVDSVSVPSSADTSCNGEQIWDEETQSAFGSTSVTAARCSEAVAEAATSQSTFESNPAKSFAAVTWETQATEATDEQRVSEGREPDRWHDDVPQEGRSPEQIDEKEQAAPHAETDASRETSSRVEASSDKLQRRPWSTKPRLRPRFVSRRRKPQG